jgi:hypothetical protein
MEFYGNIPKRSTVNVSINGNSQEIRFNVNMDENVVSNVSARSIKLEDIII